MKKQLKEGSWCILLLYILYIIYTINIYINILYILYIEQKIIS